MDAMAFCLALIAAVVFGIAWFKSNFVDLVSPGLMLVALSLAAYYQHVFKILW